MKQSRLSKNPRLVARERLIEKFNHFPEDPREHRHTHFTRFADGEAVHLQLATTETASLLGWHQEGQNLIALYEYGGAYVLFDRLIVRDGFDTVISIASTSPVVLSRVMTFLHASQEHEPEYATLFEVDDE